MSKRAAKISTIIFDFDLTISQYHLHQACKNIQIRLHAHMRHSPTLREDQIEEWHDDDIDLLWQCLHHENKLQTNGDSNLWRTIFTTLINHHYQVFIASFSSFSPIIKLFLQHV